MITYHAGGGRTVDSVRTKTLQTMEGLAVKCSRHQADAFFTRMMKSTWVKRRLEYNGKDNLYYPLGPCMTNDSGTSLCSVQTTPGKNRRGNPIHTVTAFTFQTQLSEATYMDAIHAVAHILQPDKDADGNELAPHGREFARLVLDLIGRFGLQMDSADKAQDKRDATAAFKAAGVKNRVVSERTREIRREEWNRRHARETVEGLKELLNDLSD